MANQNAERIVYTPAMIAQYVYLNEPDNYKGKEEYKAKCIGDANDPKIKEFMELQKTIAREFGFTKLGPNVNLPMKPVLDEDGNPTGKVIIIGRTKYQPLFAKPSGKEFGRGEPLPVVGGGSKIRMKLKLSPFEKGIASRLMAVQVLEVVAPGSGGSGEGAGFDAVDGFNDDDVVSLPGFSDHSSNGASDGASLEV